MSLSHPKATQKCHEENKCCIHKVPSDRHLANSLGEREQYNLNNNNDNQP